jgi:glycosyltransferase involved in cell wall biosynthesis
MIEAQTPISIIIPTLNEAGNIPRLFRRIYRSLSRAGIPFEIIVVDDHSTDNTARLVMGAPDRYNARLLMKQGDSGKAQSLLEGFAAARYELLCMIDGDLQYPPEAIAVMHHKMQYCDADAVVTERVQNDTGWTRRLSTKVFQLVFTRFLFGINYDTQSGLKLFKRSVLRNLQLSPSPWTFDLEFIVRALEQDYTVMSQPISFAERQAGVPKVKLVSAAFEIASRSFSLWRHTATKHVKLRYRRLQPMQQWFQNSLTATFLGISLLALGFVVPAGIATAEPGHGWSWPAANHRSSQYGQDHRDDNRGHGGTDHDEQALHQPRSAPATAKPATPSPPTPATPAPAAQPSPSEPAADAAAAATTEPTPAQTAAPSSIPSSTSTPATTPAAAVRQAAKHNVTYYAATRLSGPANDTLRGVTRNSLLAGGLLIAAALAAPLAKSLAGKKPYKKQLQWR